MQDRQQKPRRTTPLGALIAALTMGTLLGLCTTANGQGFPERPQNPGQPGGNLLDRPDAAAQARETILEKTTQPEIEDEEITFDAFSDEVQLSTLVETIAAMLEINVWSDPELSGSIVFNAPVTVRRSEVISFVNSLLERNGFMITQDDATGWYQVVPTSNIPLNFEGDLATTKVFPIPNIKPSQLKITIDAQMGSSGGTGAATKSTITAIDDLGVLVVTDTPGNLRVIETLVDAILVARSEVQLIPFDLTHIAATEARERILHLAGYQDTSSGIQRIDPNAQRNPRSLTGSGSQLSNLDQRLVVAPQGNRLLFRGREDEIAEVQLLIAMVDQADELNVVRYFGGSATAQIAQHAESRGLGEVQELEATSPTPQLRNQLAQTQTNEPMGGSIIVVDTSRGYLYYYGTPEQQERIAELIKEFKASDEQVVIREYRLSHVNAEEAADLLQALIDNLSPTAQGALLPGQGTARQPVIQISRGDGDDAGASLEDAFVIADIANNQLLVKATIAQHREFDILIKKIDLRRPQVYIEAKILAVSWTDDMRLAVETQLLEINSNNAGGAVNANFGLSDLLDGFTAAKTVATGLGGITAAVVKSDYVPFIIHALQTNADTRILSTPQILVNDNEDAFLASIEEQPTLQTQIGTQADLTGFGGFEEAGTTLEVTPHISDSGSLRLDYRIELSNFIGQPTDNLPPARQTQELQSSVTIPGDATIIVGGITVDTEQNTVLKVPFLGDIPIFGHLFRDTNMGKGNTTLYVFITPRIMRDEHFADIRLHTHGPQTLAGIGMDLPQLEPAIIEIVPPTR